MCVAEGLIIGFVMWQSRKFHEVLELGGQCGVKLYKVLPSQAHTILANVKLKMLI